MSLKDLHIVYFLGIGGIGMSALARWFKYHGHQVYGYDRTVTELTRELENEGMPVHYDDEVNLIPDAVKGADKGNVLIIFTPAVPKDSKQLNFFRNKNFKLKKRSEVLGLITKQYKTVAVAGTHGKTTTSSMIAHILHDSGANCLAFLGGITQNYNSNLIINKRGEEDTVVVAEADEYDRSFLALHPNIAVITSADADHLDIYGDKNALIDSMKDFINQVDKQGILVVNDKIYNILLDSQGPANVIRYSLEKGDAHAQNVRAENAVFVFDYVMDGIFIKDLQLMLPGFHNVENAVAAITVALKIGISENDIIKSISNYKGVKRRFEYIIKNDDLVFIDDYAHHPAEIEAFLLSVKALFPGRKITAIFQPHLFTRTRDFAEGFSASLSLADEVILLEIYPARELPIEGVDSNMLLKDITSPSKMLTNKEDLLGLLEERELEVVATIGAGDIDKLVKPVKELLKSKNNGNKNK